MQLSGLAETAKKALILSEAGRVSRSEIYLTNVETEEQLELCMTPEKIMIKTESSFRNYNIVERGEIKLPRGEHLERISWSGTLPSGYILLAPFVKHEAWESPADMIATLLRWREEGAKVRVLVTQTPINLEMYMKRFDIEASGGQGHYGYTIELVTAKDLEIRTVAESEALRAQENELRSRPRPKSRLGMRIGKINNLYNVVKILTGRGSLSDIEKVLKGNGITTIDDAKEGDLLIWG